MFRSMFVASSSAALVGLATAAAAGVLTGSGSGSSFARQGNLIAAWQSASAAIDEIHDRKTMLVLEAIVQQEAAKGLVEEKDG